jgi:hypothetical protein
VRVEVGQYVVAFSSDSTCTVGGPAASAIGEPAVTTRVTLKLRTAALVEGLVVVARPGWLAVSSSICEVR